MPKKPSLLSTPKKANSNSKLPDFSYEKALWKNGFRVVTGVDEVGRGALAGPVVAGCVSFRQNQLIFPEGITINDSKKLTPRVREKASQWIKENALAWGIGTSSVTEINRLGIVKATQKAFRRAIKNTNRQVNFLLIDAFYIPFVKGLKRKNQKAIIKGDTKSVSIAAASIIAKIYRDSLLSRLGSNRKYKKYGWAQNKGYGTATHKEALKRFGPTRLHRKDFL